MHKKALQMFLSAMVAVTLTVIVYYVIAALSGGLDVLVQKAFGGALSALTIIGLLAGLGAFGWYLYWLSEHRASGKATSGGHAVIGVTVLVVVAIVGIRWVQWGWGLFWLIPLLAPTVLASWTLSLVSQKIYTEGEEARSTSTQSLDDLLT